MDNAVLAIWRNALGQHTTTIRGNCTGSPPGAEDELVAPLTPNQCVVTVVEDFLEVNLGQDSDIDHVWISGLYIKSQGFVDKNYSTILKSGNSSLYLTDLTLDGSGYRCRAVDVKDNQTVFIADSFFENYEKDMDGVIRVMAGARATVVNSTFNANIVQTGSDSKVAAGPIAGLKTWSTDYNYTRGSAAWFQDSTFKNSRMAVPGEVSVEDDSSSVFTNTALPTVWHRNNSQEIRAQTVALSATAEGVDVFGNVTDRLGAFLRPDDARFLAIVEDQARVTGMPRPVISQLPPGTNLTLVTPPPIKDDDDLTAGQIAGIVIAMVLQLLLACAVAFFVIRRRKARAAAARKAEAEQERAQVEAAKASSKLHFTYGSSLSSGTGSSIPSALATNAHWVTEMDETFMATMVDLDGPPPESTAPTSSKLDFLHAQLNGITKDKAVLERFSLLGPGQRRQGGQGIVAFATGVHDGLGYALKFFVDRPSFLAERDMYRSRTLGSFLPQVHAEYDPEETPGLLVDRHGRDLPPCIVMERGEGLPDWSKRAKPDVFQSVAVLAHVATRLRDMHECGYVHRDIKPENLMFLPRENRWTVIDFGCAAEVGAVAPLSYTLVYAAPETAAAVAAGEKTIVASPSMDAWALGVVAFELLTGQSAFNLVTEGRDSVLAKLQGKEELPWEGDLAEKNPAARRRLGLFREPILSLLHRDPAERATLAAFCRTTNTVFSSPTTIEMG